jgi:hypothetical protein
MLLSSLLDVLYEKTLSLGKSKFWFLVLGLVFIIVIVINGIGVVPEEPYQKLSQNPFITRTDINPNNYWQENPFLPIIAFYLNLTSPLTFNILCFVIIAGAYALFAGLTFRRWGSPQALIFSTLLITSPLTTVFLAWMGTPDGLTVLLTIPFLFTHSSLLMFVLAIPGATNHPTFIVAIIEILILRMLANDKIKVRHILSTAMGVIIGYGLIKLFLAGNAIDIISRFDFMQEKSLDFWVKTNTHNLPISIFSLFNIHWLIFPVCLVMFFNKDRRFYTLVLLTLLINYGVTYFTLDTTRVFVLISWAVLFECIFHSYKLAIVDQGDEPPYQKQFLQALILIGIVSFVTPRYFSWVGEIHTTPFYEFMRKLLR